MSRVKRVSFEELAASLAELLDRVRADHASVVVEFPDGENLLIKPYAPTSPRTRKGAATVATNRKPNRQPDSTNVSSVGAVYDFDPNSITPG